MLRRVSLEKFNLITIMMFLMILLSNPGSLRNFLTGLDLRDYAERSVDYVYVYVDNKRLKQGSWIVYDVNDMKDDPHNVKLDDENQINCY